VEDVIQFADVSARKQYIRIEQQILCCDCFKANVTTAEAVLGAGNTSIYSHIIEDITSNFCSIPLILSFCIKHTKAGTYCVACRNSELIEVLLRNIRKQLQILGYDYISVPASPASSTWNYTTV